MKDDASSRRRSPRGTNLGGGKPIPVLDTATGLFEKERARVNPACTGCMGPKGGHRRETFASAALTRQFIVRWMPVNNVRRAVAGEQIFDLIDAVLAQDEKKRR